MFKGMKTYLQEELRSIEEAGLYKRERIIITPQNADIKVGQGQEVVNFCANNYLGLSDHPRLIEAAKRAMDTHGFGMSSVRFICGTQDIHKALEKAIADYFHTEDTILYAACFDANGGIFEPLFGEEDAIISDALNHASIIDGVRLSKAKRYRYANADMADLERVLKEAQSARHRIIVTDGVFSMDGNVAPMDKICDLAERYDALVMVDECHSAGVVGATGRGVSEQFNCYERIDIHTGTLGKAFGGAIGGFTTGPKEIIAQMTKIHQYAIMCAPTTSQYAAVEALAHGDEDVAKMRESYNQRRRFLLHKFDELGMTCFEPQGAFYVFPSIKRFNMTSEEFATRLLEEQKTAIVPGTAFGASGEGYVRVSYAYSMERLKEAISRIEKFVRSLS